MSTSNRCGPGAGRALSFAAHASWPPGRAAGLLGVDGRPLLYFPPGRHKSRDDSRLAQLSFSVRPRLKAWQKSEPDVEGLETEAIDPLRIGFAANGAERAEIWVYFSLEAPEWAHASISLARMEPRGR